MKEHNQQDNPRRCESRPERPCHCDNQEDPDLECAELAEVGLTPLRNVCELNLLRLEMQDVQNVPERVGRYEPGRPREGSE
jgi:hypothetical protein